MKLPDLSADELKRYSRQFSLTEVGIEGQRKLKAARVLCVGAGGLGSPLSLYLAAAGVGTLSLIDPDQVEASNLQRQILYATHEEGIPKVQAAKAKLLALNPFITIETYGESLTEDNALDILGKYDVIVDGTDNFPTRFLVNDACFELKKPNVYASVFQFEGQVSVFTAKDGPCYRCLYPEAPPEGLIPNCAEGGILGVLPGVIGTLQAVEVIKLLLGMGEPLIGRLLRFNALTMQFREFPVQKDAACVLCGLHRSFREVSRPTFVCSSVTEISSDEISAQELAELIKQKADLQILDVREPFEYEICNLGGKLIPLGKLPQRLSELNQNQLIVVHCKLGKRGHQATELLKQNGFKQVKNLSGGIIQWIEQINPKLPRY